MNSRTKQAIAAGEKSPERLAWAAGYDAEDCGKNRTACPYTVTSDDASQLKLRDAWMRGFQASQRDGQVATS